MFKWMKQSEYTKILVTGPQRSGTRVCAHMIAHDTGYRYVDEDEFQVSQWWVLQEMLVMPGPMVAQCPGLCYCVHALARHGGADRTLVVMMYRSIEDILASQRRVGWISNQIELAKYGGLTGIAAEIKYAVWERQREEIQYWMEIEYEHLRGHPLWVPKKNRGGFDPKQWRIE